MSKTRKSKWFVAAALIAAFAGSAYAQKQSGWEPYNGTITIPACNQWHLHMECNTNIGGCMTPIEDPNEVCWQGCRKNNAGDITHIKCIEAFSSGSW